jgi:uncharacterized protein with von Willebrand factor type A (vWA) domain
MNSLSTTFDVDLPALASAFGQRLHEAYMPVTPLQSEQYARSLQLVQPGSRRALYLTSRAIFVTDVADVALFDSVFAEIFGSPGATAGDDADATLAPAPHAIGA